jgi:hypothetical protein
MSELHEPQWLIAAVDQRLAQMREHMPEPVILTGFEVIMTPLTEPHEGASQAEFRDWDHSCDNCGRVTKNLLTNHVVREFNGKKVLITYGACLDCARAK